MYWADAETALFVWIEFESGNRYMMQRRSSNGVPAEGIDEGMFGFDETKTTLTLSDATTGAAMSTPFQVLSYAEPTDETKTAALGSPVSLVNPDRPAIIRVFAGSASERSNGCRSLWGGQCYPMVFVTIDDFKRFTCQPFGVGALCPETSPLCCY